MTNILGKIEHKNIHNKDIYIFEDHHYALYPWALARRKCRCELFSFDYHTDTHEPFLREIYSHEPINKTELDFNKQKCLIADIDYSDDASLCRAISKLHNDEHIKTAIAANIIQYAFIISQLGRETPESFEEKERLKKFASGEALVEMMNGTHKITSLKDRHYPESEIYMPDFDINNYFKCEEASSEEEKGQDKRQDEEQEDSSEDATIGNNDYSYVLIEDDFLLTYMQVLSRMSNLIESDGTINSNYVLDIDLDYFTSKKAIAPINHKIFSQLIQNAKIITIAKESACVEMCSEEKVTSEYLLPRLLSLIESSLG